MIYGIGTDIVEIDRVAAVYERFGDRFVERLLLPAEQEALKKHERKIRFLAMRFAAKEAVVKAMGTGFSHGIWIRDVGVVQNSWGKPEIIFSDRGVEKCRELGIGDGHISLSDEAGLVFAMVVLLKVGA